MKLVYESYKDLLWFAGHGAFIQFDYTVNASIIDSFLVMSSSEHQIVEQLVENVSNPSLVNYFLKHANYAF